jgi:hypothetical protein
MQQGTADIKGDDREALLRWAIAGACTSARRYSAAMLARRATTAGEWSAVSRDLVAASGTAHSWAEHATAAEHMGRGDHDAALVTLAESNGESVESWLHAARNERADDIAQGREVQS